MWRIEEASAEGKYSASMAAGAGRDSAEKVETLSRLASRKRLPLERVRVP